MREMGELQEKIAKMIESGEIVEIKIADNDYCPLNCIDGGKYRYWTKYELTEEGDFIVSYHCSSDFAYCQKAGYFMDCTDCPDWDREMRDCKRDWERATLKEVIEHIENALIDGKYDVKLYTIDGERIAFYGLNPCQLCNEKQNCSLWID